MNEPKDTNYEDDDSPDESELYDSIDELENLIADHAGNSNGQTDTSIPVLDDVVDPDIQEFDNDDDEYIDMDIPEPDVMSGDQTQNLITSEQLDRIIGSMDEKLSGELDELVSILKDAIKESIITEIKSQLDNEINDPPPDNTGGEDTQL